MLTRAFDDVGARAGDSYPQALRAEIDAVNTPIYDGANNGVYKAGFATTQAAYDEAVAGVFETLDWLEDRLSRQRWLVGGQLTEADIRLFTTLVRFDEVYHGHFKCNVRRIIDYPNLWGFTREIFQLPGIAATVNMAHIKRHYYESHRTINPTGVVPVGPAPNFATPHGRAVLSGSGAEFGD
jgi:putative glutathione S-transferase